MTTILGHHHISMLTKNAQENNKFYTQVLGMRRVSDSESGRPVDVSFVLRR